jgi:hypothetical protein
MSSELFDAGPSVPRPTRIPARSARGISDALGIASVEAVVFREDVPVSLTGAAAVGFSADDAWAIEVDSGRSDLPGQGGDPAGFSETMRQLHTAIREMPEVRSLGECFVVPYATSDWISDVEIGGRRIDYGENGVTDGYADVFGIRALEGRWFSKDDDASAWEPVVINQALAAAPVHSGHQPRRAARRHERAGRLVRRAGA